MTDLFVYGERLVDEALPHAEFGPGMTYRVIRARNDSPVWHAPVLDIEVIETQARLTLPRRPLELHSRRIE